MQTPYPIRRDSDGSISFITDSGIIYTATFLDASYHFEDVSNIYEFNLYPNREASSTDSRVGLTVVYIIEIFFQNSQNVLLYICESLDRRHKARKRKFDGWFKRFANDAFQKHDFELCVEDIEILISIILTKDNPNQNDLFTAFLATYDLYLSVK